MSVIFRALPFKKKVVLSVQTGIKQYPILYIGLAQFFVGLSYLCYSYWLKYKNPIEYSIARFKGSYVILRPDDARLKLYPAEYISDKQNLNPDHPKTCKDVLSARLPPVKFRKDLS